MIIDISNVVRAYGHGGDSVRVQCVDTCYQGAVHMRVTITRDSVTVDDVRAEGEGRAPEVAKILVSCSLVDATRRLFNLVGEA